MIIHEKSYLGDFTVFFLILDIPTLSLYFKTFKVCLKKNRTASQGYSGFTFLAINTKSIQQIAEIHTQKMRYCMLRYLAR